MVTVRPNLNGFVQLEDGSIGMTQTVHPAKLNGTALGYDNDSVAITNSELNVSPQKEQIYIREQQEQELNKIKCLWLEVMGLFPK